MYQYVMNRCVCRAGEKSVGIRRAEKFRDEFVCRAENSALQTLPVPFEKSRFNNQAVKAKQEPL